MANTNNNNQFSAETLALENIVDKITIYDVLYNQIYSIQPQLAGKITAMLIDAMNKTDIQNLLNNQTNLLNKINEAIAVLKNHQYNMQRQRNTNCNAAKTSQNTRPVNNQQIKPYHRNHSVHNSNKNSKLTTAAEMSELCTINRITSNALFYKIHSVEPQLADKIAEMFINVMNEKEIQHLLNNPTSLQTKINEATHVLNQRQNTHSEISSSVSTTETNSMSNVSINYLSSVNNQSVISNISSQQQTTLIETKTNDTQITMPSLCTIRTVRMIVNAPISKPMLQAVIEQKCISDPTCFQKIFTRCHPSYYHSKSTTVVYGHFVNFTPKEYIKCKNKLFNFDYDDTNIIGLMGNQFGIIHRVELIKEYDMIEIPVDYLSKIVRICLRCKWNEAEKRKRVCKYCIAEEINDRNKISEYYKNPKNKVNYKSWKQIESDLINILKIEPHLIPLPMYKTKCKTKEKNNGVCNRKNCTFVHDTNDTNEKDFGWKLLQIHKHAKNRRYYKLMNQYELSEYQMVALQFKYRKIISNYYEKEWKYSNVKDTECNMKLIAEYLTKCKVKLHLIPTMYKSICGEQWCRGKQGKLCYFIHRRNDQIFGNMLFKIKCNAKDIFETQSNGSTVSDQKDEILFENGNEEKKENECDESPWKRAIKPYLEANDEERDAEIKELDQWTIHSTNIKVELERNDREFEVFIIYEDDKEANITLRRTHVNVLFPCKYDVGLRTLPIDNKNGKKGKNAKKQRLKQCPACFFGVCKENEHWQIENDRMVLVETEQSKYNDALQGVVVEQLTSNNPNKRRYKVKLRKYNGKERNDITCWLKLAIVASHKYNNRKYRKEFDNVHISYAPSGQYYKIRTVLENLCDGKIERTDICKMVFGIENKVPKYINDYNVTPALIRKLFPLLNDSQIYAICGAMDKQMHTYQGPPATGKTSVCAHIAYLWWRLNKDSDRSVKIHGLVPTNKGSLVLARKCKEMSNIKIDILGKNSIQPQKPFKVLFFASEHYSAETQTDINDESICVNVMAENALRREKEYTNMDTSARRSWKTEYISKELETADMIVTTFGNTQNKLIKNMKFSHAICDECNQASLETFLGVIRSDIKQLTMAGDIQQLSPVIKCSNSLAKKSVYEGIISYLTNGSNETNAYYTRLNRQYRSHPQIYGITTTLFYDNSVNNDDMKEERDYGNLNYGKLFANENNHIQWHMYEQTQLDTSSLKQSKCNEYEAKIALKYIKKFIIELRNNERDIAIVSDYKAQIEYMKELLRKTNKINENKILVCTTNQIEGSSKPMVIYMCVRSNNSGTIGFLNDNKRVNVALSRAEYGQIIIGDINTLQYNPIYNKIFKYHMTEGAVVCENNKYNRWNNKDKWIKTVKTNISLINISNYDTAKANDRNDYHICSGCGKMKINKLFCGSSCNKVYFCENCINKYLKTYCKSAKKLTMLSKIIINKSEFFANDSNGISTEFDTILGMYLMDCGLIKHIREEELTYKLCDVAMQLCNDINNKYRKYILVPKCFKILVEKYCNNEIKAPFKKGKYGPEIDRALGIMRCKRNHLLQQNIMDTRFFQIVNKIKYNNELIKKYYNANNKKCSFYLYKNKKTNRCDYNKYTFYLCKEFEEYQPATVVVAYLQCCGYSTHVSNRLRTRIGQELSKINKDNPGKYDKRCVIQLDDMKIKKFADELYSDQSIGIKNILSTINSGTINDAFEWNCYVIKLMQHAIIEDTMGPYYHSLTHEKAMEEEISFGEKLTQAGLSYNSETELKEQGFKVTPDYHLKTPWIINYNDRKVEITWLDFKYQYCSATEWNIDHLNKQAHKYNEKFGVGAFVFSLGFCKPPKGLQLNCYGLLAAVPLSQYYVDMFIQKRINDRMHNK